LPRLVFVCTRNQSRSVLAETFFNRLLKKRGLGNGWQVESAGSWVDESAPATAEAIAEAEKRGCSLEGHVSRDISEISLENIDLMLVMEKGQKEAILLEYPQLEGKVQLLSEMSGKAYTIPDPYLTNEPYTAVALEIENLINTNFEKIINLAKGEA
jgi:protein-tyrosine phosphatase